MRILPTETDDSKKKTGTSPLYTYGGGMPVVPATGASTISTAGRATTPAKATTSPTTSNVYQGYNQLVRSLYGPSAAPTAAEQGQNIYQAYPEIVAQNTPTYTDKDGLVHTWNPRTKMYEVTGKVPVAGETQTPALTPEQLFQAGQQLSDIQAGQRAANIAEREALSRADMEYFGGVRRAAQRAGAQETDWRAVLAGAGLGRSPVIGGAAQERIQAALAADRVQAEATRQAQRAQARGTAAEARADAARRRAALEQYIASQQSGNAQAWTEEYLRSLGL